MVPPAESDHSLPRMLQTAMSAQQPACTTKAQEHKTRRRVFRLPLEPCAGQNASYLTRFQSPAR